METKSIKKYSCPEQGCTASFTKNSKLDVHLRKHTGERPFKCNEENCDKAYTNASHLRRHKNVFHEKKVESTICPHEGCSQVLSRYNLNKHLARKHNPLKKSPFQCSECKEGFNKKRQLQLHSYEHTGKKPFVCHQCDLNFTTPKELNQHQRYHKKYTCDCEQIFNHWSVFIQHKKHCETLRCKNCNKQLTNLQALKLHSEIHKDKIERVVFNCDQEGCNKFYLYEKNLQAHKKTDHGSSELFKCDVQGCNNAYKFKHDMFRHKKTKHLGLILKKSAKEKVLKKIRSDKGKPKDFTIEKLMNTSFRPAPKINILENIVLVSEEVKG